MRKKEDLRIRKTKTTLYNAYLKLISEKDKSEISISDLCKNAKINRSTFYDHFKDKEELASSLLNDTKEDIKYELEKIEKKNNDIYLLEIIKKLKELLEHNKTLKAIRKSNPPLIRQMISTILKEFLIEEINLDKTMPLPLEDYALFYSEGITALLLNKDTSNLELDGLLSILPKKK